MTAALAIDLGSSMIRVANERGELLFDQPSVAARERSSGRVVAIGDAALDLGASGVGRIALERPVRAGKLSEVELAEAVIAALFRDLGLHRLERTEVALCTHVGASEVQRRALERALRQVGGREVRFVEQPIAAALGAGLPIAEPTGTMVLDVGGGVSDVGVMALGGLVTSAAVVLGGTDFDEAIRRDLARRLGLAIGRRDAERLRRRFGTLLPEDPDVAIELAGRDVRSGRVQERLVTVGELSAVLNRLVEPLFDAAVRCVVSAPPDLANDLLGAGLLLAGGASRLPGLDRRLASATGVPVHVVTDPQHLSVFGAARCLGDAVAAPSLSAAAFG